MIATLTGKLAVKEPGLAVVDVAGVGYLVQIPLSTFTRLGDQGEDTRLFTHLSVRENAMELFGFGAASDLVYWRRRPPAERLAAVERLRAEWHENPGRLQRIARVVQRTRR